MKMKSIKSNLIVSMFWTTYNKQKSFDLLLLWFHIVIQILSFKTMVLAGAVAGSVTAAAAALGAAGTLNGNFGSCQC